MTVALAALLVAALALAVAAGALVLAVQARAVAVQARGSLARHRESHAKRAEERRAVRHGPTPTGPATQQVPAVDAGRGGQVEPASAVRPPVRADDQGNPDLPATGELPPPTGRFRQPPPPLPPPGAIVRPQ